MKKLLALLIVVGVIVMPFNKVSASHQTPGGANCDNGWRHFICRDVIRYTQETHDVSDKVCTITHYYISHQMECTSCHAILASGISIQCTDYHSLCDPHYPAKTCTTNFYNPFS